MPVVDASVAIKWFIEEPDSVAAHQILDAHASGESPVVAPDLLVYEVANVLLHSPVFSTSEAERSVARLYELELELIAPSMVVVTDAIALASERRLTFYDAIYVQLARHLELTLYTADHKLILKLRDLPFVRSL